MLQAVALSPGSYIMEERERWGGKIYGDGKREPGTHWFVCEWELLRIFIDDISGNIGHVYYVDIDSGPPGENECYAVYVRNTAVQITTFAPEQALLVQNLISRFGWKPNKLISSQVNCSYLLWLRA